MRGKRLLHQIRFLLINNPFSRRDYIKTHRVFHNCGESVCFQLRKVPLYGELISIGNNVVIASDVKFRTHDAFFVVLNRLGKGHFPEEVGCIEVKDNVYIGYSATIMPNVRLGKNVIVGAGTLVSKDLEHDGVYVGTPAKRIGSFDDFVKRHSEKSAGGQLSLC